MQAQLTGLLDDGPWRTWQHRPAAPICCGPTAWARPSASCSRRSRGPSCAATTATCAPSSNGPSGAAAVGPCVVPATSPPAEPPTPAADAAAPPLTLANGLGGFTDKGRAYAIVLEGDQETPLPWVERHREPALRHDRHGVGLGAHLVGNSRENRLTPFANDPIIDPTAEALFIRDDDIRRAWSPTPGPMRREASGRLRRPCMPPG